jgi:hypothetical protein
MFPREILAYPHLVVLILPVKLLEILRHALAYQITSEDRQIVVLNVL